MAVSSDARAPRGPAAPGRGYGPMLAVLLSAWFMAQFDFFVVNVAAPALSHGLGAGPAALELIVGGYAFAYAAGMITGGRLGDLLGHRRMFVTGIVAFTLASLLCGLASTPGRLIAARILQGLGGAIMVPQVLAVITTSIPKPARPRALGWYGVAGGSGSIAGQVLGGVLLNANVLGLGWRVIFLVNVPLGMIVVPLAVRLLPGGAPAGSGRTAYGPVRQGRGAEPGPRAYDPAREGHGAGPGRRAYGPARQGHGGGPVAGGRGRTAGGPGRTVGGSSRTGLDLVGAVGVAAALGLVLVPLALGREAGWPGWAWACLAAAVPVGGATLAWQRRLRARGGSPVLDPALFREPTFVAGIAAGVAFMLYFPSFIFVLTLLLQGGLGLSALQAGLAFAPMGAAFAVASLLGARSRHAYGTAGAGAVLTAAGLALTGILAHGAPLAWLIVALVLVSAGNGLTLPRLIGIALVRVSGARAGAGAGVLTTSQQFAGSAGIAIVGTVYFALATGGYAHAMAGAVAIHIALLAVVLALIAYVRRLARR